MREGAPASRQGPPSRSKVVVDMQGAKKGLIVNSTNLCANVHRADAQLLAHSGARESSKPVMGARCGRG